MATSIEYFSGKAKWAHTSKPDKYGKWSILLYPDAASLEKIQALKNGTPAILNNIRKDEDGYNVKFSSDVNKSINGKVIAFTVAVLKPDGAPLTEALVGNGSDVTLKCEVYTYRKGEGKAVRLKAVRVDNLVPFVLERDFTDEQKEQVSGLLEQPAPLF